MIVAAKCAPEEKVLNNICKADLKAVELYLSNLWLKNLSAIAKLCKNFPVQYAVHAPNDSFLMEDLAWLSKEINAKVIVFHNIYWEDEWPVIVGKFKKIPVLLCIENTYSVHEPMKFMRRYNMARCLDLEHLQMETTGIYEEIFIRLIQETSHIHMTGYKYGSTLWHTHIHHLPEHSRYILNLLAKAKYKGFVVSEAKRSLQTYEEFQRLNNFFTQWKSDNIKSRD